MSSSPSSVSNTPRPLPRSVSPVPPDEKKAVVTPTSVVKETLQSESPGKLMRRPRPPPVRTVFESPAKPRDEEDSPVSSPIVGGASGSPNNALETSNLGPLNRAFCADEIGWPSTPNRSPNRTVLDSPHLHSAGTVGTMKSPANALSKIGSARKLPKVDFNALIHKTYVASGEYAHVYSAYLNGQKVAVKVLKVEWLNDKRVTDDMHNERTILSKMDRNEGIAEIKGYGTHNQVPFFVLEFLPITLSSSIKNSRPQWPKVFRYAKEIAMSMAYLHSRAINGFTVMHRDLKPDNIMIADDGSIRLVDFGLVCVVKRCSSRGASKFFSAKSGFNMESVLSPNPIADKPRTGSIGGSSSIDPASPDTGPFSRASAQSDEGDEAAPFELLDLTGRTGSLRYMAPEVSRSHKYNELAEVYTWALLFWEITTGMRPYLGISAKTFEENVCEKGFRPDMNQCKNWSPELKALVQKCWSNDIRSRPSFTTVVKTLSEIEQDMFGGNVEDIELQVQGCSCAIM